MNTIEELLVFIIRSPVVRLADFLGVGHNSGMLSLSEEGSSFPDRGTAIVELVFNGAGTA